MLKNREKRQLNKETQEKKRGLFRRRNKGHDLQLDEENALTVNNSMETRGTVNVEADDNQNFETKLMTNDRRNFGSQKLIS